MTLLKKDLDLLTLNIKQKLNVYLNGNANEYEIINLSKILTKNNSTYGKFILNNNLTDEERILVLLALAHEIKPEVFEPFCVHILNNNNAIPEFGGYLSANFRTFIPTIKTAYFLLADNSVDAQLKYNHLFASEHKLFRNNILKKVKIEEHDAEINHQIRITDQALSYILKGEDIKYEYSTEFPAAELVTEHSWGDLVLSERTELHLKELLAWLRHGDKLINDQDFRKKIHPGYRALFYGPSGTGKTLTAALLGQKTGKPVYRIDLSRLVSKYIGDTEKNLERIFNLARDRNWILFFDEADALFGKRTGVNNSNDRHANQGTAYLLQRIESCENIVILASNLKGNIDDAFTRRFQSIVEFPMPEEKERLSLWKRAYPKAMKFAKDVDLNSLAKKFDISGGQISNVVRYTTLMALQNDSNVITTDNLIDGLRCEYRKAGRSF